MRFVIFSHGNAVTDGSWSSTNLMSWSVAEPDIYLITACLPTLRPILTRVFRWEGSTAQSTSRYATNSYSYGAATSKANATVVESALYGDEVQLVSIVGNESHESREDLERKGIYVQKQVDVQYSESDKR